MTISVSQSDGARSVQDKFPHGILTLKPKYRESWVSRGMGFSFLVCKMCTCARGSFRFKHFIIILVYMTLTSIYIHPAMYHTNIYQKIAL